MQLPSIPNYFLRVVIVKVLLQVVSSIGLENVGSLTISNHSTITSKIFGVNERNHPKQNRSVKLWCLLICKILRIRFFKNIAKLLSETSSANFLEQIKRCKTGFDKK